MQKVLVFTDIHLVRAGESIIGLDPVARFRAGLTHALATHPDAAQIVITGDLSHHGSAEEYELLRAALSECPLPVRLMVGNHDDRAVFRTSFPETPVDANGFVQSFCDLEAYRLVFLDTVDAEGPIEHAGILCPDRLNWLEATLRTAGRRKVILFLHHPPMRTGFAAMDRIGLRNRQDFGAFLQRQSTICQIVAGHVHRTIFSTAAGIPAAVFKSTCHQMPMALEHTDEHVSVDEPGAYGILLLAEDGVIVLSEDFGLPSGGGLATARPNKTAA